MATVTLADDWIHSGVIAGYILGSQRQCDINDSDVPPYRLQAATSKQCWGRKKRKRETALKSFDLDSIFTLGAMRVTFSELLTP